MTILFSDSVRTSLNEYSESLTKYPISEERANVKIDNMRKTLERVGLNHTAFPICKYKDLGQTLDDNGNPLNTSLRQFNYSDESKFKWCFSFIYDKSDSTVTFIKMMPAIHVKESMQELISRIINETLNEYLNKNVLY